MATKRPKTVAEYIAAAPKAGQPHLKRLRTILREVAPDAEEVIKWNTPFYVEPRFLFSFSANKAHLNLTVGQAVLAEFLDEIDGYDTTTNFLNVRYDQPLPEALIRRMAKRQHQRVKARKDDGFW
jgi:uncharacterized protein YdhG (YjbR/CyaY superfamily)